MPLGGFTVEQLEEELSDFSCNFDGEQEFVDKMNALSHAFHIDSEDLINETMGYAMNLKRTDLDVGFLDAFEAHYKKKNAPSAVSKSKPRAVLADLKPTTAGTPRRTTKLNISAMEIDDELDMTLPRLDCSDAPPHVKEFVILDSPAGPGWFVARADSGKVVSSLGGDVARERRTKKPKSVTVKPLAKQQRQVYGEPKAAGVLEGMNARLEAYGEDVRAANAVTMADAPYASLVRETESPVFIIGFVATFDARAADMSTVELERDEAEGAVAVTVDVSALDERCFFPGQMAVFQGTNRAGNLFEATAHLTADRQPCATVARGDEDAVVWVAAGPFTPPSAASYEPLAEIVERARQEQPDVLVLVGPLVDRQSKFLVSKACTVNEDQMTHELLKRIALKMKGCPTRVLFMPSSARDGCAIPVYPGAGLREGWKDEVVELVSDPLLLVVGCGAEVAITASDIMTHLSRAESYSSSNKENTDRMKRVAGHMLEQRSLYPLYPPSLAASLEGIHTACTLSGKQPHVIVAPSMLTAFAKSAYGSVIVNPGSACKGASVGTLMKMRIGLTEIPDAGTANLERYTHVSITKI